MPIPEGKVGAALRQHLHEADKQYRKARKEAERAIDQLHRGLTP